MPAGSSVGEIGDLLAGKGIISNATLFEIRATISGKRGDLNHGVHQFRENMSYSAAIDEPEQDHLEAGPSRSRSRGPQSL